MRSLRLLTIAPLVWLALCAAADAQRSSESRIPTHQQLSRLGLERVWWAQATINPNRDKIKHVVVDEDAVYVQTSSGITTAFDAETGREKWSVQIGRFDQVSFRAVANQELVLVLCGSSLHALDKNSGRTAWVLDLAGVPSTSPTVDDKQVYFGTVHGAVFAYSLKKIRKLYEERRLPQGSEHAKVWKYQTGKEITSSPIVAGHAVYFASLDGSLYSVTTDDRKLIYQLQTDKPIVAPLARLDDTMFMTSEDHSFFALNVSSESSGLNHKLIPGGKVKWEFTSGLPIRKPLWALSNDLYLLPDRGGMYCLNPQTGSRRWWHPNLTDFLAVLGTSLAASDVDGNLVIVSRDKGEIVGSLPLRRFTIRPGNECTDRVVMSTESGLVICLRQHGRIDATYFRYPDRLPLLPEFATEEGETEESMPSSEPKEENEQ